MCRNNPPRLDSHWLFAFLCPSHDLTWVLFLQWRTGSLQEQLPVSPLDRDSLPGIFRISVWQGIKMRQQVQGWFLPPPLQESACRVLHEFHDMHKSTQSIVPIQQPNNCPPPRFPTLDHTLPLHQSAPELRARDCLIPCSTLQCLLCS